MESTNFGTNIIIPKLFLRNVTPEIFEKYLCVHFNFMNKNFEEINFPLFYNFMELPLFISNILYNSFKNIYPKVTSENFIEFCRFLYLGDYEIRIKLLFSILNMENLGQVNILNSKLFFVHLKTLRKTTKEEIDKGYLIIEDFFNTNKDLSFEEFKNKIINENSDLFYLFIYLLIKHSPINEDSINHYEQYFIHNNNQNKTNILNNIQKEYYSKLQYPSGDLQEYLNNTFGFNFIIKDELSDLNKFEFDLREITSQYNPNLIIKNNITSCQNLITYPNKNNLNIIPVKNKKSAPLIKIIKSNCKTDDSKYFNKFTFNCFVLKKKRFISCFLDIVGKDIFIYHQNSNLSFVISTEKLYVEVGNDKNKIIDDFSGTFKIPIYFNSFLFEKIKKYVLYFDDLKNFEKIKNLIIKSQKFCPPNLNKYKCEKIIGKGAFGEIIKIYNPETEKYIAMKKIKKVNMFEDKNNNYFDRWEKDICYLLKNYPCPYIIEIYNIYEDNNYIYIMQELAEKGNLIQYILTKEISKEEKYQIIRDIARAIELLHSFGIVHRDLKCENILLSEKLNKYNFPQIKIIDFGLSEVVTINKKLTKRIGTLIYIPPEIILEQPYNQTIDIWAFGIISFMVLYNGNHPFINNINETINTEIFKNIVYKELSKVDFSEKYKIIFSCLAKTGKDRPNISQITNNFHSLVETTILI